MITENDTVNILVNGMTCAHCVASVTEEISAIADVDGVEVGVEVEVEVDLNPGGASRVTVRSTSPIDPRSIRVAVEEAGYTLAGTPA